MVPYLELKRNAVRAEPSLAVPDSNEGANLTATPVATQFHDFSDFGMREDKEIEWAQLHNIVLEYICAAAFFLTLGLKDEPPCGIPIKKWVTYYMFFRCFRNIHNIVGLILIVNNQPIRYTSSTKLLIFGIFE